MVASWNFDPPTTPTFQEGRSTQQALAWLGAVAFLGLGEVEPDIGSLNFKDLLPAGGVGARITVAKANHVNARADVAFSKEGVSFYFSVGEAF